MALKERKGWDALKLKCRDMRNGDREGEAVSLEYFMPARSGPNG